MKSRVLVILGIITVIVISLIVADQYYLSYQDKELKKSDWVQNCIPAGPNQAVPSIGLYNHTHSFDLLTCTWNMTERGAPGFLESLYTSFIEPIFLDVADILEVQYVYAIGRGPLERLPLDNVTILDMDDSMTVKSNELSIIKIDYHTNYPNTKYIILIQITNEKRETVLLNWIEGIQINLSDNPGSYVCGDKICYDQWSTDNPYICGNEICPNKYSSSKSLESSWVPTEAGIYEIVAFAWESVDNPSALSPPFDIEVIVVKEKSEKNHPPTSIDHQNLIDAKKLLQIAYYENVNLGPLKINDVIVGFGIENDAMIMDVLYRYSTSSEMDIVKKKIRNIVGDEIEIEYIPYKESSRFIQKALVYHWNEYLHKNNIEFAPAYPSHGNNDDGIGDGTFLCSPLLAPNGTEFYIVSTVIVEPFLITDTFVDIEKPEFCRKTWKTDVILEEPDRVISLWLEMGQGKITTE